MVHDQVLASMLDTANYHSMATRIRNMNLVDNGMNKQRLVVIPSEETIYRPACKRVDYTNNQGLVLNVSDVPDLSDQANRSSDESIALNSSDEMNFSIPGAAAGTRPTQRDAGGEAGPSKVSADERARQQADDMIREAINAKSRLLQPPGERINNMIGYSHQGCLRDQLCCQPGPSVGTNLQVNPIVSKDINMLSDHERSRFYEAMLIDQTNKRVGAHLDTKMQERIGKGEFVNLQRLLPKRALSLDPDDQTLQMTNNGGH